MTAPAHAVPRPRRRRGCRQGRTGLALALLLGLVQACASAGVDFDSQVARSIRVGVDTRSTVEERLGPPRMRQGVPKGAAPGCVERWMYRYARFGLFSESVKVLVVDFDARGVVCYTGYDEQ